MRNLTTQHLWDVEYLKGCLQEGLEIRKTAQFDQDWKVAETEAVRRLSNAVEHYAVCRSAACRRARRCVGNTVPCRRLSEREMRPGEMQGLAERLYKRIQQERRAAAYEGRPPRVNDAVVNYRRGAS
jgi:hypothetical protein